MGEAKRKAQRYVAVEMPLDEVQRMVAEHGLVCAWAGCNSHYKGEMPPDWRCLLVFWAPAPVDRISQIARYNKWDRDAVLCPKHVAKLESLLIDIGNQLGETQGSA
jgi:hypothetical protein